MKQMPARPFAELCPICDRHLPEPADIFCSGECSSLRAKILLVDLKLLQVAGPKRAVNMELSLELPHEFRGRRWFYFVDAAEERERAYFGALQDVERCIASGGWPRPIDDADGRAMEDRVDAWNLWGKKR